MRTSSARWRESCCRHRRESALQVETQPECNSTPPLINNLMISRHHTEFIWMKRALSSASKLSHHSDLMHTVEGYIWPLLACRWRLRLHSSWVTLSNVSLRAQSCRVPSEWRCSSSFMSFNFVIQDFWLLDNQLLPNKIWSWLRFSHPFCLNIQLTRTFGWTIVSSKHD